MGSSSSSVPELTAEQAAALKATELAGEVALTEKTSDTFSSHRTDAIGFRKCYNRACPDYGRERPDYEDCACKKTSIKGVNG